MHGKLILDDSPVSKKKQRNFWDTPSPTTSIASTPRQIPSPIPQLPSPNALPTSTPTISNRKRRNLNSNLNSSMCSPVSTPITNSSLFTPISSKQRRQNISPTVPDLNSSSTLMNTTPKFTPKLKKKAVKKPVAKKQNKKKPVKKLKKKCKVKWRQGTLDENAVPTTYFGPPFEEPTDDNIAGLATPSQFFQYFFDEELLTKIVEQTNLYSMQLTGKSSNISITDMKQFLGICILSSVVSLPSLRCLWNPVIGSSVVQNSLSVNYFEKIKRFLHFNDNDEMVPSSDPGHDRLHKIRPVITKLLQNFQKVTVEEYLSLDEQLCATKHRSYLRQYIPSKPHKYGYKLYVLCGVSGYAYNFEIYTGQEEAMLPDEPLLGATGNVVIRLTRSIPRSLGHKLFFDNYYTSVPLLVHLEKEGIHTSGTIRFNRLPDKDQLKADIEKNPRGDFVEYICSYKKKPVVFLAWKDNKVVSMVSTYRGSLPVKTIQRYDRKEKVRRDVKCPALIDIYNKHMGGVDTMDAMIGRQKIKIKSKKWYLKLFFHLVDIAIVNAWLLARRVNAIDKNTTAWKFRVEVAQTLCASATPKKMGRPTAKSTDFSKSKLFSHTPLPNDDIRLDELGHWPVHKAERRMCRMPSCKNKTSVFCTKCQIFACFTANSNCFTSFHTM